MRPFLCWHNRAPFLLRFSSKLPAPRPCYFWYLDQMAPGKQHRVPNLLTCMPWHGRVIASLCHTCYMYKSLGCSVALIAGCACNQQQSSFIPIFLFISCSFCSADTYRAAAGKQVALVYSFFDVAVLPFWASIPEDRGPCRKFGCPRIQGASTLVKEKAAANHLFRVRVLELVNETQYLLQSLVFRRLFQIVRSIGLALFNLTYV